MRHGRLCGLVYTQLPMLPPACERVAHRQPRSTRKLQGLDLAVSGTSKRVGGRSERFSNRYAVLNAKHLRASPTSTLKKHQACGTASFKASVVKENQSRTPVQCCATSRLCTMFVPWIARCCHCGSPAMKKSSTRYSAAEEGIRCAANHIKRCRLRERWNLQGKIWTKFTVLWTLTRLKMGMSPPSALRMSLTPPT